MYIDSHCHLNISPLNHEIDEILTSHEHMAMICVGINAKTSRDAVELARSNENIYAVIGIHPHDIAEEQDISFIDELATDSRVIGIGECGFDFFRERKDNVIVAQEKVFRAQIEAALKHNKPLMIHTRSTKFTLDAYDEALRVLGDYSNDSRWRGAQIHFFVGNVEYAQKFLDLGCMLSFTGVVTLTEEFNNVLNYIPADRMLCETDAPFVSPQKYRGQVCYPKYVEEVYAKIAQVKGADPIEFATQIEQNFKRFYQV